MTAWLRIGAGALAGVLATVTPAHADVTAQTEQGFVSRNVVVVAGSPAAVWKRLVTPAAWWSSEHTFSGDAANMTLDPVAGGCFCEFLPADDRDTPKSAKPGAATHPPMRGGVQHMRVVFIDRAKALRMVGALGPLQSEAVNATLTVTLKEVDGGTRVIFEYVVGGYMRFPADKIATAVDSVMGNQLLSLANQFGRVAAPREEAGPPSSAATGGGGLDKRGLLLPRGKVWSLPSGPAPERAPAALPALSPEPEPASASSAEAAPLPTAPVQEDVAPAGGAAVVKRHAARKHPEPAVAPAPEPHPVPAAPDSPPAVAPDTSSNAEPAPQPKPAPKTRVATKKGTKPTAKPVPPGDEPSKDSVNSAFDAAFGGAPRPASDPQ